MLVVQEFPWPRHTFTHANGLTQSYIDEGEGPVLLCLHGNPTWSFMYRHVVDVMKKTHRVIALDHMGCGFSSKPQAYPYTLEQHIQNLSEFINRLKLEDVSLLLHDWGGAIGLGWAVQYPNRVKKLILLNTAAFTSKDLPKRIALGKIPGIGPFLIRRLNAFAYGATVMATAKGLSPHAKSGFLHPYSDYDSRVAITKFVEDIPMSPRHPSYETLLRIEKKLSLLSQKPTLILWGMKDFCFHKGFLDRWLEIYPEALTFCFEKGGHYVLEDEKESILSLVEGFMNREHSHLH